MKYLKIAEFKLEFCNLLTINKKNEMQLKVKVTVFFILFKFFCFAQNDTDSLTCKVQFHTFDLEKVWEYENNVLIYVKDTINFDNKVFYHVIDGISYDYYYSNDDDGNIYIMDSKKGKYEIFIPKQEILNWEFTFNGYKCKILNYHAGIKTPFCI